MSVWDRPRHGWAVSKSGGLAAHIIVPDTRMSRRAAGDQADDRLGRSYEQRVRSLMKLSLLLPEVGDRDD